MGRYGRRVATIVAVAGAALLAAALPAFAKGDAIPVRIRVTVTGPGVAAPIVLRWEGYCMGSESCDSSRNELDSYSFLNSAGLMWQGFTGPGPVQATLGPRYEVTYRVVSRGRVETAHQDLYPFGPGTSTYEPHRPWLYAQPGQHLFTGMLPGGWIAAPTSLLSILRDHGFAVPAPPPATAATASNAAAHATASQPSGPSPWALVLGAVALTAMVVAGAIVGRRSQRPAVRPAATS
jgi:hypothetical protein